MARRRKRVKPKLWTMDEIKKLQVAKACGMETKDIAAMFPDRSYSSVAYAIDNYCKYEKNYDRAPVCKRKRYNPNPPTPLTYILVHNYYEENIRHGMTRAEAIADVGEMLNRSETFVKKALKVDIRKYVEKDEEDETDTKKMELRHTYIR